MRNLSLSMIKLQAIVFYKLSPGQGDSESGIGNRIYIRREFKESIVMNLFSPFQPEKEFKVYKSCKCSQIICSRVH